MKKRKWKTAAEAMAEFEKDPAFVERRRQREEERRRAEEADARAEAPIVEELRKAAVPVGSIWDLVNSLNTYAQSLPILLDHLQRPYPDAVREGLARAVAVPGARFAWPLLVRLYGQEQGQRAKHGLAVALSNIVDDETLDELIELARDVQHGDSRVLLLSALEGSHLPQARKALMDLGSDPALQKEVQRILRRLRRVER
jgi:hypothetical protein